MKTCSKCGETKLFSEFYKRASAKDGLHPHCKPCASAASKAYAVNNAERLREKRIRDYAENAELLRAKSRAWHHNNRDQSIARSAKWKAENKDRVRTYKKEKDAQYYVENRHRILARSLEWQKTNPDKANARNRRRLAAKLRATPSWADHFVIDGMYELAQVFRGIGLDMHVDHIVPLRGKNVCGFHSHDNLQLLIGEKNLRKHARFEI